MSGSAATAMMRLREQIPMDRLQRARAADAPLVPKASAGGDKQETRWRGASRSLRSLASWFPQAGGPRSDTPSRELQTLRARSRDAFRGNLIARAALTRPRTNIVGTGLMCRPSVDAKALGLTQEAADEFNAQLASYYNGWAEDPNECDIESTLDFYGHQGLALLSAMASGDVFVLTPTELRAGGAYELKLQLVEADRISNPEGVQDSERLVQGIELRGATPVACHIRDTHPGDRDAMGMPKWQRYPFFGAETGRRRVLQVWNDKERPGQPRGVPYLAPILEPLKQLDRYGGAELMAAVVSGMTTVFIERAEQKQFDEDGNEIAAFAGAELDEQGNIALGNGAVVDLAPGEKANLANPARPNANFDPFFVAVVKQIGAALELPLDELLLHYQASYSAARAAMLQAWRFYTMRRWTLVQQFCQPVYNLLIDEGVASGRLRLPGYDDPIRRRAWCTALWIGPARGSMDEAKEANAAKTRIEIGVSNESIETAAMAGEDWHQVIRQRANEVAFRRANGLPVAGDQPHTMPTTTTETPAGERPGGDDGDGIDDGVERDREDAENREEQAA
ncbi:MAG TPA: phage portal protein [Luteimonas sp.]|nr:phage portal protein [Luteimonas sp.]